jgi:hypothetical protein
MGSRRVDPELLVGSREIADRVGARHTQHIQAWLVHDRTFPAPVAVLGRDSGRPTYIWYWPDVEHWAKGKGRILLDGHNNGDAPGGSGRPPS